MLHIEQPLQLIILYIKFNKYKQLFFFHLFPNHGIPANTHTQKFNINQEKKMIFFATPSPSGGGEGLLQPLSPLISGMTPLEEKFYHSFVALTLIGR